LKQEKEEYEKTEEWKSDSPRPLPEELLIFSKRREMLHFTFIVLSSLCCFPKLSVGLRRGNRSLYLLKATMRR
jgi:hypothetical protein